MMRIFILTLLSTLIITSISAQPWQTLFYDDFNRADGTIGSNYSTSPSGGITQLGIINNEVKVANSATAPAYWIISYINAVDTDNIRISCKFKAPNSAYGFSISARDDSVNTYRAGIMSNTDSIVILRGDYVGNSVKLAGEKAYLDTTKTYFLEFTLISSDLTFRFVELGMTDTITINATDNVLSGTGITLSAYYYLPDRSVYIDDFKIESFNNSTEINNIEKEIHAVFPNPGNGKFTIKSNSNINSIEVYNLLGEKISLLPAAVNQLSKEIDLSNLSKGIYFLKIYNGEKGYTEKVVIQ